jgi:hypothetical protein
VPQLVQPAGATIDTGAALPNMLRETIGVPHAPVLHGLAQVVAHGFE